MFDESKLPEDLKAKLKAWDDNSPANKQLRELTAVKSLLEEVKAFLNEASAQSGVDAEAKTALLHKLVTQLETLNNRPDKELPDYAQPVVDAVAQLKADLVKTLLGLDMKPVVEPNITVPTPEVHVAAPVVDLTDLAKAFTKSTKSFTDAIANIKLPENPDYRELFEEMLTQLQSIDMASRMKPQFPTTLKVTNPDGSEISGGGGGSATGLLPFAFDDIEWSGTPDSFGNYPTATVREGGADLATLTFSYDVDGKLTRVQRT